MKHLDTAARQIAKLANWAIDESLARLFPPPAGLTYEQLLAEIEEQREVFEPGDCDCILGSPTPWSHEDHPDVPTGAARTAPPQPPVDGTGGRLHDELTWVLTVILRRHLAKTLGINGAIAPVIAKAAATELLHHFHLERRA